MRDVTAHGRLNCEDDSDCADIPCVPPYVGKCVSLKLIFFIFLSVVVTNVTAQGKLNCKKDSDCFMFSCVPPASFPKCVSFECTCHY
ncbi:hypothetical protein P8452_30125 [Trifolium repens]|nr:hypothetical protein P8452_30125 [Trifolium repens]